MSIKFITLLTTILLTILNLNKSSITNMVNTSAIGDNAKSETNIKTNVNGTETIIHSNQSGSIEVKQTNDNIEVTTSGGITPTIIINKKESITITPTINKEKQKKIIESIKIQRKNLFTTIFQIFKNFFSF